MIKINLGNEVVAFTGKEEKIWKRLLKKEYKHTHGRNVADGLKYSMQERPRTHYEYYDHDDVWYEYGFFNGVWSDGTPKTDDEIREYIDEYIREVIRSPYDCTGQRFSMWIDWHRNPCGLVSYINHLGLDV